MKYPAALAAVVGLIGLGAAGAATNQPSAACAAQCAAKNPAADWAGIWVVARGSRPPDKPLLNSRAIHPLMTPEYAAKQQEFIDGEKIGKVRYSPQLNCIPPGMPDMMYEVYALEILPTPGLLVMVAEYMNTLRHIYTDGRPLPADPERTYAGTSVGRWEGDTLVIDTIALPEDGVIIPGMPHSDAMKVRERIRALDRNTLQNEMTLTDPKALKQPMTLTLKYERAPADRTLREFVCAAGNRYHVSPDGTVSTVPWARGE